MGKHPNNIGNEIMYFYAVVKNERTKLNTFFAESIYGVKLIKVFNRQVEKQNECEKRTSDFARTARPLGVLQGFNK